MLKGFKTNSVVFFETAERVVRFHVLYLKGFMADSVVFFEPVAKKQLWPLGPDQHHKVYLAIPERLLTLSPCSIMQGSAVDWRRV